MQAPVRPVPLEPDTSPAGDEFAVAGKPRAVEESFSSVTPRVTVQYRWMPDVVGLMDSDIPRASAPAA